MDEVDKSKDERKRKVTGRLTGDPTQRVEGYYCQIKGCHYIILDNAKLTTMTNEWIPEEPKELQEHTQILEVCGFVEVDPSTVKPLLDDEQKGGK